ncbi:hypothetical protein BJX70DRAFT_394139 [Aspergillus crustosus]
MDQYRERLAATLREDMADLAAGAVLAGSGNSGDAVRIVTDAALILWDGDVSELDETSFWRSTDRALSSYESPMLEPMALAALVKCFVLE